MSMPSLSAAAFRASVRDRLKTEAKKSGRPVKELQREFVLQRFLSRVLSAADSQWGLKGGTGLLIRLPGARYSQDLDLLHPSENLEAAIEELKELSRGPGRDSFSFVVGDPVRMSGGAAGVKVKVDTYLGTTLYCTFPIDLSTELPFVAQVEHRRPRPVLEVPGVDPLPEFTLYPLPDQVADKVCAMYERHGPTATPSSRFRDLVDLVLIVSNFELALEELPAHRERGNPMKKLINAPDRVVTDMLSGYLRAYAGKLKQVPEVPGVVLQEKKDKVAVLI